jgi:hypothetical protein
VPDLPSILVLVCTQVLSEPGSGKVLVVDGGASLRCALLGDQMAEMAAKNDWEVRRATNSHTMLCELRANTGCAERLGPPGHPACPCQRSLQQPLAAWSGVQQGASKEPVSRGEESLDVAAQGIIINGCVRDTRELAKLNICIKAIAPSPLKSSTRDRGLRDVPVTFGGVTIRPGDWVYADEDGVLVSPEKLQL